MTQAASIDQKETNVLIFKKPLMKEKPQSIK